MQPPLAKYLKKRKMTQEAFSMLTGMSRATVNHLVSGYRKPSLELALEIERLTKGAVPVTAWRK